MNRYIPLSLTARSRNFGLGDLLALAGTDVPDADAESLLDSLGEHAQDAGLPDKPELAASAEKFVGPKMPADTLHDKIQDWKQSGGENWAENQKPYSRAVKSLKPGILAHQEYMKKVPTLDERIKNIDKTISNIQSSAPNRWGKLSPVLGAQMSMFNTQGIGGMAREDWEKFNESVPDFRKKNPEIFEHINRLVYTGKQAPNLPAAYHNRPDLVTELKDALHEEQVAAPARQKAIGELLQQKKSIQDDAEFYRQNPDKLVEKIRELKAQIDDNRMEQSGLTIDKLHQFERELNPDSPDDGQLSPKETGKVTVKALSSTTARYEEGEISRKYHTMTRDDWEKFNKDHPRFQQKYRDLYKYTNKYLDSHKGKAPNIVGAFNDPNASHVTQLNSALKNLRLLDADEGKPGYYFKAGSQEEAAQGRDLVEKALGKKLDLLSQKYGSMNSGQWSKFRILHPKFNKDVSAYMDQYLKSHGGRGPNLIAAFHDKTSDGIADLKNTLGLRDSLADKARSLADKAHSLVSESQWNSMGYAEKYPNLTKYLHGNFFRIGRAFPLDISTHSPEEAISSVYPVSLPEEMGLGSDDPVGKALTDAYNQQTYNGKLPSSIANNNLLKAQEIWNRYQENRQHMPESEALSKLNSDVRDFQLAELDKKVSVRGLTPTTAALKQFLEDMPEMRKLWNNPADKEHNAFYSILRDYPALTQSLTGVQLQPGPLGMQTAAGTSPELYKQLNTLLAYAQSPEQQAQLYATITGLPRDNVYYAFGLNPQAPDQVGDENLLPGGSTMLAEKPATPSSGKSTQELSQMLAEHKADLDAGTDTAEHAKPVSAAKLIAQSKDEDSLKSWVRKRKQMTA